MAIITEQDYNAAVYELIDAAIDANPSGIQAELQKHNFAFPYGQNAQLAEKYLLQLYQNNTPLFWDILSNVRIDISRIAPAQRDRLSALVPANSTTKGIGDYYQQALDYLKNLKLGGTKTEGTSEQTVTRTSTGAYIAYILIALAIVGIAFYLIKITK